MDALGVCVDARGVCEDVRGVRMDVRGVCIRGVELALPDDAT